MTVSRRGLGRRRGCSPEGVAERTFFGTLRIAILLAVLVFVALGAWLDKRRSTDWDSTLRVTVYPIAGGTDAATTGYLATLEEADFDAIEAFFASHHQVLLEFAAEERLAGRVIEGERRERVDHSILADVFAEERLDADDAEQDVHGDAGCGRGLLEFGLLQAVDLGATRDATLDQELGPVLVPRQRALGRFRDRLQDRRLGFDLCEQRDERFGFEAVLLADAGDEGVDVGARGIESLGMRGLRMVERKRERNRAGAGDAAERAGGPSSERFPYQVETSLRREWTAMRIPNPAMRVTSDVPP